MEEAVSLLKSWIKDALVSCLEENLALDTDKTIFTIDVSISDD